MASIRRAVAGALAFQLLFGGVGRGQVPQPAGTNVTPTPTSAKHLVWRVSRSARTVAFLVGSIHVLSKHDYPLPPVFDAVFEQSTTLVEEIDLGAPSDATSVLSVAAMSLLADGETLRGVLDAKTYDLVGEKAGDAGLPIALLDRMKPWLVAISLAMPGLRRAGFDPAYGLDRYYYDRATRVSLPVRGLETAASQMERLNGLPMPVQVEMLRATLEDIDAQIESVSEIVAGWRTGDVAALERLLLKEFRHSPAIYERLVVDRNRDWIPKITQCTETGAPCLVVVGGAHLLGPHGLVVLLREAGFILEQL